ncbi:hypothetical protein M6D81_11605 [Paenibacillus sp. J5C_2022]|uniref:hypothetical protein n=1 Tax=Paenibacillus sp. J5C2022 TaxID=2977129 RepID=UPI0021D05677|nr:hypothetical protein [Paenibacillus sp. J5C2022]MCU6709353.1 hypothetical protein [Paenibacillus sp. J5C2022]
MALIPLKQEVTVYPKAPSDDPWNPSPGSVPFTLKCRFQEGTAVVTDQHGREVVSSAQIFFDKFAPIKATDEYGYVDETGSERRYLPLKTERKRWLNGKAILTVVYVK